MHVRCTSSPTAEWEQGTQPGPTSCMPRRAPCCQLPGRSRHRGYAPCVSNDGAKGIKRRLGIVSQGPCRSPVQRGGERRREAASGGGSIAQSHTQTARAARQSRAAFSHSSSPSWSQRAMQRSAARGVPAAMCPSLTGEAWQAEGASEEYQDAPHACRRASDA